VALGTVRELHRSGANLESLGRDILELLRNLAVAKLPAANGPQSPLADLPDQEAAELTRLSAVASNRDLMRLFRLMADAQEQLIRSPYSDLLLEMVVIRMATLAPVIDADELLQAIGASVPAGRAAGGGSASGNSSGQSPHSPTAGSMAPTGAATKVAPPAAAVDAFLAPTPARRIRVEGEVKAEAPPRAVTVQPKPANAVSSSGASAGAPGGLPDLREFIGGRRAALFGFMEQGAALALNGDVLTIIPRNDIYIRYLSDNRGVIGDLASELYGRRIRVELAPIGTPLPPAGATSDAEVASAGGPAAAAPTPSAASHGGGRGAADIGGAPASAEEPQAAAATDGADAAPSMAAAEVPAMSQADLRQTVYADPVVRRIFDEFEARLVEVRVQAAAPLAVDSGSRKP
jgi:DNA polymerase-3 subunit gamma/tau